MKNIQTILLLGLLAVLQACGGSNAESESDDPQNGRGGRGGGSGGSQATSVETFTVSNGNISKQIRSFGNIRAEDIVNITPQVSNRVTQIYAQLGDTVRQGDRLAKIYDTPFQDQYAQARAQLEQSRVSFERDSLQFTRQQQLYERELISSTEFDNARATFQSSKAQLQASKASMTESKENLDNTVIRSPVYGVVLTRNFATGDLATSGQVAFEIANLTGYETRVYLPLEEWESARVGQEVSFRISNRQKITSKGRVARISPTLDPVTGLGEVVIALTEKGPSIYQGVLVESIINVETHEDAVIIPRSALVENVQTLIEPESNTIQLDRSYSAFVVQDDSLALQRKLELGIEEGDRVEILSGLQAGDRVVITGQTGLEDSSKVQVATGSPFQEPEEIPIETGDMSKEEREEYRNADDSTRKQMREQLKDQRKDASDDSTPANAGNN